MVIDLFSSFPSIAQWLVMLLVAGTLGYVLHYILSRKKWAKSFRNMENRIKSLEFQVRSMDELKQQQSFLFDSNNDITQKLNEHDHLLSLKEKNSKKQSKKSSRKEQALNAPNFVLLSDFNEYVTHSSTKANDYQKETDQRLGSLEKNDSKTNMSQWTKKFKFIQEKQEDFEADNYRQDKEIENLKARWKKQGVSAPRSIKKKKNLETAPPLLERLSISNISTSADSKDDLKLIKGVGPIIEKKVNKLGIYTFEQISQLTNDDIEAITEAIEFFPGRIQRDGWKKQATSLMKKKVS